MRITITPEHRATIVRWLKRGYVDTLELCELYGDRQDEAIERYALHLDEQLTRIATRGDPPPEWLEEYGRLHNPK